MKKLLLLLTVLLGTLALPDTASAQIDTCRIRSGTTCVVTAAKVAPQTTDLTALGDATHEFLSLYVKDVTFQTITTTGNVLAGASSAIGWTGRARMSSSADGVQSFTNAAGTGATRLVLGPATSSFPGFKVSGTSIQTALGDDSGQTTFQAANLQGDVFSYFTGGKAVMRAGTPTVSSGFGTGAAIVASNGATAFTLNVGTGGVATSGIVGLPTASTGWNCWIDDRTTSILTRETATTTTTATITAASAWTASDILQVSCFAF